MGSYRISSAPIGLPGGSCGYPDGLPLDYLWDSHEMPMKHQTAQSRA